MNSTEHLYYELKMPLLLYVSLIHVQASFFLQDGRTALHHAVLNGEHAVIQQLVDYGADVTIKDYVSVRRLKDACSFSLSLSKSVIGNGDHSV